MKKLKKLTYNPKRQTYKNKVYIYDRGPIYGIWMNLRNRCTNPKNPSFPRYGGRGIKVDPRWNSFTNFRQDMETTFKTGLTIERIDNSGDYSPENCRWATRKEQALNRRSNWYISYKGIIKSISQWAEYLGIQRLTLRDRLISGWSLEKALETSTRSHKEYKT